MRAAPLLAGLGAVCASCSGSAPEKPKVAQGEEKVACALGGASELKTVCALERVRSGDDLILIVHHPDGAFRRFVVESDGTGLSPADGASEGSVRIEGDWIELTVDDDRYRFPMTRMNHAQTP